MTNTEAVLNIKLCFFLICLNISVLASYVNHVLAGLGSWYWSNFLGILQLSLGLNVISILCVILVFFFGCENIQLAGITVPYLR